jgi:hypothetical protein
VGIREFAGTVVVLGAAACAGDPPSERTDDSGRAPKDFVSSLVPLNAEVAREARVDLVQPGGASGHNLTGAGVRVAQWDEGAVRETHRELLGRVAIQDGAGLSDHATHVAATIAGSGAGDPATRGMAPAARLFSYSWELDLVEIAGMGPFVSASSHAYGNALGWQVNPGCPEGWSWAGARGEAEDGRFGRYGALAAALDRVTRDKDLLSVWAAGNDRDDGPASPATHAHFPSCDMVFSDEHATEIELEYDTLGSAAVAKNVLTVGAIRDLPDAFRPSDIEPHAASSFGPADDGRIKPEVCAGGDDVRSASAGSDDAYADQSGTSSAAGAVTGILALLVEQYRSAHGGRDPRASELKALLVQTAEDPSSPGPDYGMGYGLVDARAAADFIDADANDAQMRVDVSTGPPNELVTGEVPEGTALRATLAWLDPPGPVRLATDDPAPALVNDLDLALVSPDGSVFHPWSLDREAPDADATRSGPNRLDTLEVVDVDAADNVWTGQWTLRVEAPSGIVRDVAQAYAVLASVPISTPSHPIVGSATRAYLGVSSNGFATLSLTIENLGRGTLDWSASTDAPFLSLETSNGSAGDDLVVRADGRALGPAASGFAELELESSEPGGSRTVGLLVETTCAPDCAGRTCGPDPACGTPCGGCGPRFACTEAGSCAPLGDACPSADLGSALGSAVVSGVTAGASAFFSRCGGELGADSGFSWTAPSDGRYSFSTEGSTFDTILSIRRDGCSGTEIVCNDDTLDLSSSVVVDLEAGDPVTAIVDGFDGATGVFSLGIHPVTCPDGELGPHLGRAVLPDASPGRLDRSRASCAADAAREAALGFTAPVDGLFRFDASASSYEATVALLRNDCSGEELACANEAAEVTLSAGEHVVVVIDGALAPDDRFTLGVTTRSLECGGDCSARPGDGLCSCDERCVELGDCCVDACGECAGCTPEQTCEFGRCIPRRCIPGDCGCGATGGTGSTGCDGGAGGVPGEAGAPQEDEPVKAVEPSGCTCRAMPRAGFDGLGWLGIALVACGLASRRGRI